MTVPNLLLGVVDALTVSLFSKSPVPAANLPTILRLVKPTGKVIVSVKVIWSVPVRVVPPTSNGPANTFPVSSTNLTLSILEVSRPVVPEASSVSKKLNFILATVIGSPLTSTVHPPNG